jgi:hypothetical protein
LSGNDLLTIILKIDILPIMENTFVTLLFYLKLDI